MIKLLPHIVFCGIVSVLSIVFGLWFFAIPFMLIGIFGYCASRIWQEMEKEPCHFCNKELGMEYHEGKTMHDENDGWAHKGCVPKIKLKEWKATQ